jgi:diguanylate cyclase (GGDEF)-like protein
VEDERFVARDLCKTLEDLGYQVGASARSLEEALLQADAQRPDLVLMDIHIKGVVDGIEAAAQLKHRHPVPIVFLTASTDERTLQRAFRERPDGYLPKPFTRATLRTAIEVALQRREVESRLRQTNLQLAAQKCELESRTNELRRLSEMGDALQACDTVIEVMAVVSTFGRQLFPEDHGAFFLIDGPDRGLHAAATWGQRLPAPFAADGCLALRRGRVHRVTPPDDQVRCVHLDPGSELTSLCVPIATKGATLGVLSVAFRGGDRVAQADLKAKEQLVSVTAQRVCLTLANLCIKDQLLRDSIVDPLTGLFNRRHMNTAFDRELQLASRNARPVGVLMFDVDRFKSVNDQWGHAAGDIVLCEMAKVLRSRLRAYDVATRYGGDEIVVILPDTTIDGTRAVAEKIRLAVRELRIVHGTHVLPPTTISAGVAAYPLNGNTAAAVLDAADLALFRAKAEGRDRVALAETDPHPLAGAPSFLRSHATI